MLTAIEINKLFNLLELYHSDKKAKRDKATVAAWQRVLRPWNYEQAREAADRRAQSGNRFFPDAPEIAAFCPDLPEESGVENREEVISSSWGKQLERVKKYAGLVSRRREAGLPATLEESRASSLNSEEWSKHLDEAGLGVEAIL